jgi:RND family efflux transporter MFP subunit
MFLNRMPLHMHRLGLRLICRGRVVLCFVCCVGALPGVGLAWAQSSAASSAVTAVPGITQALKEVKLSMSVSGRIESVAVKEGDRVRRGDLLLHLERESDDLEVRRRQLLLEDSSKLEELKAKENLLGEQVIQARQLLEMGGLSRKQVEDEELAWQAIKAERKAMEFAKRREQVELDLAKESFRQRHLRSPIDGVVTRVLVRPGESMVPNEPVVSVVDTRRVRFNGTFQAHAGVKLRAGASVMVRLGQDANMIMRKAKVIFVSPVLDAASGLVEVIAEFDNQDGAVRPGVAGHLLLDEMPSERPFGGMR